MKRFISVMIAAAMLLSLGVTVANAATSANPIINVYSEPFDGTGAGTYYKPSGYDVYKVTYTTQGIDTSEDLITGLTINATVSDTTKVASKSWSKPKTTGATAQRDQNGFLTPYGIEPNTVGVGKYVWASAEGLDVFDWDTYDEGGTQETFPYVETLIYVTAGETVTLTYNTAYNGPDPTSVIAVDHDGAEVKYTTAIQYKINGVAGNVLTLGPVPSTKYTITFKDYDGTTLKSDEVTEGETPVAPANPSRVGYTFTGWDSAIAAVTGAKIYTATYSQNTYTITFKDYDGTVLKSGEVAEGDMPVAPTDPSRAGYNFTGWDSAIVAATEAKIYTATYEQILYTVTFTNEDNSVIKTDNLVPGAPIVKPANPTKANAVFVGWSADGGVSVANVPATADKAYTFKAVFKNIPAPVEKEAGATTFKTYTKGEEVVSGVTADADYVAADATLTEVDNTLFRYKVVLTGTNKATGAEETQEFDDIEFGTGAGDGEVELSGATAKLMVIVKAIKHNITKIAIKALGR